VAASARQSPVDPDNRLVARGLERDWELLSDTPGALWSWSTIEVCRRERAPDLTRAISGPTPRIVIIRLRL
jgi:hypothetical protein